MKRPRTVTFYSFKGGVGRTLALLNVAVSLAREGRRVVVVDMDLEAPSFHRYQAIAPPAAEHLGVSDYILDRLTGRERTLEPYRYTASGITGVDDRLVVVPAGQRPSELADEIARIYTPPDERALIFQLFLARMTKELQPDFILFDSRTGLAEIAAVCTVELADVIVALTGLNPQGVDGLADVIGRIRRHPARKQPPLFILVYSPIPRLDDLDLSVGGALPLDSLVPGRAPMVLPLATRIAEAHAKLWKEALAGDEVELRQLYPDVSPDDRLHFIEYDPWVPLIGEDDFDRPGPLRDAHVRLAEAVGLTHGGTRIPEVSPHPELSPLRLSGSLSDALTPGE